MSDPPLQMPADFIKQYVLLHITHSPLYLKKPQTKHSLHSVLLQKLTASSYHRVSTYLQWGLKSFHCAAVV